MTVNQLLSSIHSYPDIISYCDMTGDEKGCIYKDKNGVYNGIELKNFLLKYRDYNIEDFDIYIDDVEGFILCITFKRNETDRKAENNE